MKPEEDPLDPLLVRPLPEGLLLPLVLLGRELELDVPRLDDPRPRSS